MHRGSRRAITINATGYCTKCSRGFHHATSLEPFGANLYCSFMQNSPLLH